MSDPRLFTTRDELYGFKIMGAKHLATCPHPTPPLYRGATNGGNGGHAVSNTTNR